MNKKDINNIKTVRDILGFLKLLANTPRELDDGDKLDNLEQTALTALSGLYDKDEFIAKVFSMKRTPEEYEGGGYLDKIRAADLRNELLEELLTYMKGME